MLCNILTDAIPKMGSQMNIYYQLKTILLCYIQKMTSPDLLDVAEQ